MTDFPDSSLLQLWLANRDARAFRELARRHSQMVFATCRRILRDPAAAEDVTQECFLALAQHTATPPRSLPAWLHVLAVRRSLNCLRSSARQRERELRYAKSNLDAHTPTWDAFMADVDQAIASLPEDLRTPLILHFLEEQNQDRIAHQLGISQATVSRRIDQAIEAVRVGLKRSPAVAIGLLAQALRSEASVTVPATLSSSLGKLALTTSIATPITTSMAIGGILLVKKAIAVTAGLLILGGAFFYLNSSNIQIAKPTMPLQKANPPAFNPDVSIPATPEVQTELPDSTTPSLARQKTVELQEGTVSGKVTDVATGAPLPGITVTATDTSTQSSEPQSQSAITEIDGTYRITGLLVSPNAAFQVKCDSPDGFRKLTYSKRPTAVFAGTLHVENIDIALEPEALLSGIVVDPQNAPVSDAEVVLAGGIDEHVGATVRSVADGSFVFRSLPPAGDLFIMARVADGAVSEPMAIALPETGLTDLVIVVLEACSVSGTIVDTSGNPLPGLEARALRVPADRIGSGANGHADENGQFEIRGLPPGQYELVVLGSKLASHGSQQKGVGIGLEPGQQLTDVQLVYNRDLSISGVVLDSSNVPIPGAEVSASSVDFGGGVRATTDASGRFTVTDLEEGNYSLQVNAPGHQYVDVYGVEAGSEGVEIVVADPFRVTGRVVDSETGKPITEFEISTQSHWGDPADANITEEFRKRSSLDGSFELVQEQAYPIILTARGEGYATGYTILDLTGPPYTREVELRLDPGGDLQGSVVDSSGTAVADALIFLGPVYTYGNRSVAKSANDGSFQLQAFPNTTQRISAYKPGYATGSVVVDPSTDGDEPVRIILPNGATIQGTLTFAPSMETVPCTIEMVYPERHSVQGSAVDLQPDGSYIIERVQPGDATVCARVNTQASFADRIMLKKNVHVTDRGTHTVDFYIQSATGAIEGTVRFPDGAHPSHVQVNVTVETTAGLVGKSDVVKHSGAFSFEGLPAGKGTVQIQASFQNHTFIEKIMSMEVREDKTSSLNIEI